MLKQRCVSRLDTAARRLLLASLAVLFFKSFGQAQQLFVDSMWVEHTGSCVGPIGGGTADNAFICAGPGVSTSAVIGSNTPNGIDGGPPGNISNNPHIEFDQIYPPDDLNLNSCRLLPASSFPSGSEQHNICNARVFVCAAIGYSNLQASGSAFAIDQLEFDIFQWTAGANPLDPQSTPPLRTLFVNNPGLVPQGAQGTIPIQQQCSAAGVGETCGFCVLWDGSINILGEFGKENGQFGFRTTVMTNQTNGTTGNINITNTQAYPSATTKDSTVCGAGVGADPSSCIVEQRPIVIDVTDVHAVRSTPTVVGTITGVAAEPYNITYRLSKDAVMSIQITDPFGFNGVAGAVIRDVLPPLIGGGGGLPRVGEGTVGGSLQNGDAWNGRHNNGDFVRPGNYLATLAATSNDQYGNDTSAPVTRQIALDPLQITDILVSPLTSQSTALAVLTYTLTEPATAYIDIYPPGTQFCNFNGVPVPLSDVNNSNLDVFAGTPAGGKFFGASLAACGGANVAPIKTIVEQKTQRTPVISFWDGRDQTGSIVADGDYVFVAYASFASQNGRLYDGAGAACNTVINPDCRIWTTSAKTGFIPVARGNVTISQLNPVSTVIGSSPSVAGLNPFFFNYTLSRDAMVSLNILDSSGQFLIRSLVTQQTRPGNFVNREIWPDGLDNNGMLVSSGTYLAQLTAADPFVPSKIATTTVLFPVNLFRIVDVSNTPLLTSATAEVTLSYQLSNPMNVAWNIYAPGTVFNSISSLGTWPPCGVLIPGVCAQTVNAAVVPVPVKPIITVNGMRPGRLRITEFWDGRDTNGLFVPDGNYPFTLVAQSTTTPKYFASDIVTGMLTVARGAPVFTSFTITPTIPALFNSSQTITLPPYDFSYALTRQSSVTIQILTTTIPPVSVRTVVSGQQRESGILNQDFWDGRSDRGNFVPNGQYTVQATAYDLASALSSGSTVQQSLAVDELRIYDVAVTPIAKGSDAAIVNYQVSETMKTSLKIYRPGTSFDPAGNPTPPEPVSLVRFLSGVRPARTEISDTWDGRDFKLSLLPDGNYRFRLIASTDTTSINSITGSAVPGAALADDLIIADVPIVRSGAGSAQGDFVTNTFIYPNPVNGSNATFNIWVPFQADVSVKLYTLAGDLVFDQFFANQADSYNNGPIVFPWNRSNSSNRRLAAGVYFLLVRETDTKGGQNVLQTIKKILLQ